MKLLPCPGCGLKDGLEIVDERYRAAAVVCKGEDGCGWRGPAIASDEDMLAREGAVEAWNRRTPAAPPASTLRQSLVSVLDGGCFDLPDHYLDELVAVVENHCDAASAARPDCGGTESPRLAAENERLRRSEAKGTGNAP